VRNVPIFPPSATVYALVVDAVTGLPIPQASVSVSGTVTPEGVAYERTMATDVLGSAQSSVYAGAYTVTASATGYEPTTRTVSTANGSVTVTVALTPGAAAASGGGNALGPTVVGIVIAGGTVAAAAGAYLATRRLSAASADSRSTSTPGGDS